MIPTIPTDAPIITVTSNSGSLDPADHGIDPAVQWWALAVRRPRLRDARVTVSAPGGDPYAHVVSVTLPADDDDDTEATALYALDVARILVATAAGESGMDDWDRLKSLMSPQGPLGGHSSQAWHRTLEWLKTARGITDARVLPVLDI